MKTNRRNVAFSSLALSGLVAVSVVLSAVPAIAVDYQPGCYPPFSKACELKPEAEVTPSPKPNPSPQPTPSIPKDESALKNLVKNLQSDTTTKPIQVSDEAKIGGKANTVALEAKVDTSKKTATVQAQADKPISVLAGGFQPGKFGGYVDVFVSVSGRVGNIDLGSFTADSKGNVKTPPLTLKGGARATFIFRELVRPAAYKVNASKKNFSWANKSFSFANYGAEAGETVLFLRSTLAVTA